MVSADGTSTALATFDRPLSLLSVNDEFVLGLYEDDLEVQGVAVYRYETGW